MKRGLRRGVRTAEEWAVRIEGGAAQPEEREAFEHWLRASAANAAAYEKAVQVWRLAPRLAASPNLARLRANAELQLAAARRAAAIRTSLAGTAMACSLALAVYIGGDRIGVHHRTAVGEQQHLTLADGSRVDLNADSDLWVGALPWRREVRLVRGEAFFQVVHDEKTPFTVHVGTQAIRDIGTQFEVTTNPNGFEVAVVEGAVELLDAHAADARQGSVLLAGNSAEISGTGRVSVVPTADAADVATWRRGWLVYKNAPLAHVVRDLNRYSTRRLVITDAAVGDLPFAGAFHTGDIDAVIASLRDIYGIEARTTADRIELYSKRAS